MKNKRRKVKNNRGFSLFMAVAVASILLFLSFAILRITLKEILFSSTGRDSQFAFYAADSGIECALFWDNKVVISAFSTSTASTINCNGQSISTGSQTVPTDPTVPSRIGGGGSANATSTFWLDFNSGSNPVPYCVIVDVGKWTNGVTFIESRGYNTCDTTDLRRVERGIEVYY